MILDFSNVLRIQHRNESGGFSEADDGFLAQLDPVEAAVPAVRVDAYDRPFEPALAPPDVGIQEYLDPVADLDCLCHPLSAAICPEHESQPDGDRDPAVDRPLRIACHIAAGQDIDPLQEPDSASQDEQNTDHI